MRSNLEWRLTAKRNHDRHLQHNCHRHGRRDAPRSRASALGLASYSAHRLLPGAPRRLAPAAAGPLGQRCGSGRAAERSVDHGPAGRGAALRAAGPARRHIPAPFAAAPARDAQRGRLPRHRLARPPRAEHRGRDAARQAAAPRVQPAGRGAHARTTRGDQAPRLCRRRRRRRDAPARPAHGGAGAGFRPARRRRRPVVTRRLRGRRCGVDADGDAAGAALRRRLHAGALCPPRQGARRAPARARATHHATYRATHRATALAHSPAPFAPTRCRYDAHRWRTPTRARCGAPSPSSSRSSSSSRLSSSRSRTRRGTCATRGSSSSPPSP